MNFMTDELKWRRAELSRSLSGQSFAVLINAGAPKLRNGDVNYIFRPESSFYYFTGLDTPAARLLILGGQGQEPRSVLFIERNRPELEVWTGRKTSAEEAGSVSGVNTICYLDEFEERLLKYLENIETLYFDAEKPVYSFILPEGLQLISELRRRLPNLGVKPVHDAISELRLVKSDTELACIRKAAQITSEGLAQAFCEVRPGVSEAVVEARLSYEYAVRGSKNHGFPPIIASGSNATTLHYEKNDSVIGDDHLVLMDVGAEYNWYSGDVTRTVPASGRYEGRGRDIYQATLMVQKAVIEKIKPGVMLKDLNQTAFEVTGQVLRDLGLVADPSEMDQVRKYFMHGISHYLGLDAHDPGPYSKPLVPGVVLTVEPGIYVKEEGIGIRIEDDVLVTDWGCEVLTTGVPKEISEVESLLAGFRR